MSSTPPPIPAFARPDDDNSFARNASLACLASPLVALGVNWVFTRYSAKLGGEHLGPAGLPGGWVSCAVVGIGLILGISAILLMKEAGRRRIVWQSLIGMAAIGLLAAIDVPNYVRARTITLGRIDAEKQIRMATKNARKEITAGLTNGRGSAAAIDHFQKTLDDAATKTTGEDALMIRTAQSYLREMQLAQSDYQKAYNDLIAARVLATSNLVARTQIEQREVVVRRFLASNDALSNFISNAREVFSSELAAVHISQTNIDAAVAGFERTAKPQQPFIAQIRGDDDELGRAMLGVLELLDAKWGHWQYTTNTPHLVFEDRAALTQYNDCLASIRRATSDQTSAQNQLVATIQRIPTAQ